MKHAGSYALILASAAAVAATAILLFSYAFHRGESYAEGSSYRATPDGLRALALLLESQGLRVTRLSDPWELDSNRGLLVTMGATFKSAELRGWVERGNQVLLLGPGAPMLADLGIHYRNRAGASVAAAVPGSPWTEGAPELEFKSPGFLELDPAAASAVALYGFPDGAAAVMVPLGRGRVIVLADGHPATNEGLPDHDNAVFLVNVAELARESGVIFDETPARLAMSEPGLMAYARKAGVQPLFLEAGLLALLALWHFGSRVGPPMESRPRVPPAVPDYVTGRSRLYEMASMERTAVAALADTLRDGLRKSNRLDEASEQTGLRLLEKAEKLGKSRSRKKHELVAFARSIHDFMNEVLWKSTRRPAPGRRTAPSRRK